MIPEDSADPKLKLNLREQAMQPAASNSKPSGTQTSTQQKSTAPAVPVAQSESSLATRKSNSVPIAVPTVASTTHTTNDVVGGSRDVGTPVWRPNEEMSSATQVPDSGTGSVLSSTSGEFLSPEFWTLPPTFSALPTLPPIDSSRRSTAAEKRT